MSETREEQREDSASQAVIGQQKQPVTRQVRIERLLEVTTAVLLGVVAVATAWSGYQATRWSGQQSALYTQANALQIKSTGLSAQAGQYKLYDTEIVSNWLNAYTLGNTKLAQVYERRFRPELRPAFQAWLATDPFHNPQAPPGPLFMPQYRSSLDEQASRLASQADRFFKEGQTANDVSDNYVLDTVFLATVLFLGAIADSFSWKTLRVAILLVALGMLLFGLYHLFTYPVL